MYRDSIELESGGVVFQVGIRLQEGPPRYLADNLSVVETRMTSYS